MDQIKKEIEYIMLVSIARSGFEAMPQDYAFLKRYSLLSFYIEIINARTERRPAKHFEGAAKAQAAESAALLDGASFIVDLRAYFEAKGRKATKEILGNNVLYWNSFLKLLKNDEHTSPDKQDS